MQTRIKILFFLIFAHILIFAQENHKCGALDPIHAKEELTLRGNHWGYGYQDLLNDLPKWENSSYISIDSIGKSVQNRALWELRISSDDSNQGKHTIYIHVRTHPNEVQSFWVANEMIKFLTSEDSLAVKIRSKCVFYMVPMYNPDGVELEYPRKNANNIDIESNWYADTVEPEVKALRSRFVNLMGSDNPIEIALNLHSAYKCKRYFVYHHENGTSLKYSQIEKMYINFVVNYFISGFEPWNFFVTWKNGTPKKYPESWWWLNFKEKVLALTYEDGNCEEAGDFDKTAYAILAGIADYFKLSTATTEITALSDDSIEISPNPIKTGDNIFFKINTALYQKISVELFDFTGRKIKTLYLKNTQINTGKMVFMPGNLKPGMYFLKFKTKSSQVNKRLIVLK